MKLDNKRVPITIYTAEEIAQKVIQCYAKAVLKGYNGTKQQYLNKLLNDGLKEV